MRTKWDILERRHWGGWNWLTCSKREGNIKQTLQPTLVVADSPKKGTINTERLKPFWEPWWLVCPSPSISWQGSNSLVFLFYMDECVCVWECLHLYPFGSMCLWVDYGWTKMDFLKLLGFYKWWARNDKRLTKHIAYLQRRKTLVTPMTTGSGWVFIIVLPTYWIHVYSSFRCSNRYFVAVLKEDLL